MVPAQCNINSNVDEVTKSAVFSVFFFFNDTATTEIYTLSLHDALPISGRVFRRPFGPPCASGRGGFWRSEEHTSELQSRLHLVCRLLLEKKKNMCTHLHDHRSRCLVPRPDIHPGRP